MVEENNENIIRFSDFAKVQAMGKDRYGNERYMVYITAIAKKAGITKGDKVIVSINKVAESEPIIRNPNSGENFVTSSLVKNEDGTLSIPLDTKTDEEEQFLAELEEAKKKGENSAEFVKKKGIKQFGEKRVERLLK